MNTNELVTKHDIEQLAEIVLRLERKLSAIAVTAGGGIPDRPVPLAREDCRRLWTS